MQLDMDTEPSHIHTYNNRQIQMDSSDDRGTEGIVILFEFLTKRQIESGAYESTVLRDYSWD